MTADDLRCTTCGDTKRIFFVRPPLTVGLVLLGLAIAVSPALLPNLPYSKIFTMAGLMLLVAPIFAGIRVRCIRCEPQWKSKVS
jgi:cyanate permease